MKSVVKKTVVTYLLPFVLFPFICFSQDITGIWKGYFVTDGGQNYKLEFQVEQNKSFTVTGVSYSYGNNIEFYGKATMSGHYSLQDKNLLIQEIRTVEVKSPGGGTCIMNYRLAYSRSGKEEFLEGTYVGKREDRNNPNNNGQWGDCGAGKCYLRRVQSSDFYVEPFLRDKAEPKKDTVKTVSPISKPTAKIQDKQVAKPVIKTSSKPFAKTPTSRPIAANTKPTTVKKDTVRKIPVETSIANSPVSKPEVSLPVSTRSRQNELTQTFIVTNEEIHVRLYDNGEVDGDTISVYLDGKALVTNKGLSTVPINLTLKLDPSNPEHTLVMVAENMGRIPPNTSLMIVQDGDKRYQASITSTEQKNAMVRFRYEKKTEGPLK